MKMGMVVMGKEIGAGKLVLKVEEDLLEGGVNRDGNGGEYGEEVDG